MLLKDKVAIITGAASARGLGFATAKLFAENGAKYEITDSDTGTARTLSGVELRETGLTVKLDRPRSSAMFRIRRQS